jgi:hypothetical protein
MFQAQYRIPMLHARRSASPLDKSFLKGCLQVAHGNLTQRKIRNFVYMYIIKARLSEKPETKSFGASQILDLRNIRTMSEDKILVLLRVHRGNLARWIIRNVVLMSITETRRCGNRDTVFRWAREV